MWHLKGFRPDCGADQNPTSIALRWRKLTLFVPVLWDGALCNFHKILQGAVKRAPGQLNRVRLHFGIITVKHGHWSRAKSTRIKRQVEAVLCKCWDNIHAFKLLFLNTILLILLLIIYKKNNNANVPITIANTGISANANTLPGPKIKSPPGFI